MKKIVARIKGGLGNQLFCYAAARRMALLNNAELVIDKRTGFIRDKKYRRNYMLDCFRLPAREATSREQLFPFERCRRGFLKWVSRRRPFEKRIYLEQENDAFDPRLLSLRVSHDVYLDGLWQSEAYFQDVSENIRKDLDFILPCDDANLRVANEIRSRESIALHVRWFERPGDKEFCNIKAAYYKKAIAFMEKRIQKPWYFLFSDDLPAALRKIPLPLNRMTPVSHNGSSLAWADMWLMSQCKHFIISNSTFSWWGAWLGETSSTSIVAPSFNAARNTAWADALTVPTRWITF